MDLNANANTLALLINMANTVTKHNSNIISMFVLILAATGNVLVLYENPSDKSNHTPIDFNYLGHEQKIEQMKEIQKLYLQNEKFHKILMQ